MTRNASRFLCGTAGYTLTEALVIVAAIGMVTAFSAPSISRFKSMHEVQAGISQVGGRIRAVRAQAVLKGVPHLILFEKEEITDGDRSTFALVVEDIDRSYTITNPDRVELFELSSDISLDVTQYDAEGLTSLFSLAVPTPSSIPSVLTPAPPDPAAAASMVTTSASSVTTAPRCRLGKSSGNYHDVLAMYADKAEDWAGAGSPGCSRSGSVLGSLPRRLRAGIGSQQRRI